MIGKNPLRGDIDWNEKVIFVRRSFWKDQFQSPKSKHSVRKIDIPSDLIYLKNEITLSRK